MIELKNIIKRYQTSTKKRKLILNNISLQFPENGFVFVVGEKDSGKTTLLNLIAALDQPNYGSIYYQKQIISFNNIKDIYNYRDQNVSMIFSGSQMTMFKTVGQEIYRILRLKKIPKDEIRPKVEEILDRFKISNLKNKFRWMIKKDEMKLIGLAISYAKDTPIILVDDIDLSMIYYLNELSKHKLVIATTSDENFALEHATKLIMLENGQISKNIDHDPSIYIRKEESFIKTNLEKKRCKSKFFNFAILISSLLILMLSLFTLSTFSTLFIKLNTISQFDIAINQISDQEIYLAPVAKYQERAFTYGWSFIVQAGTFDYSQDVHPSYRELLVDKTNNLLDIYESYFFNKNLQDFFPITLDIPKIFQSNNFKSFHFTEVIVVDDFSNFRQPLLYGELPSLSNDILIYDYMAEQIIGSVNLNMTQINELIGYEFVDRDTQLSFVVSGIMKSQYQDFYHIQQTSYTDNIVELSYIQELQSIVSKPELLSLITLEKDLYSIDKITLLDYNGFKINENLEYRKIRFNRLLDEFDIIGITSPQKEGVILSKHQFARMLNVDVDIINEQYINALIPYLNYQMEMRHFNFDYKMNKSIYRIVNVPIYGVYDSLDDDEHVINYYKSSGAWYPLNGSIRRFYLSLTDDFELNKQLLSEFKVPDSKSFIFFYENVTYQTDDFGLYHSSRLMGEQMMNYVIYISEDFLRLMIISSIILIIASFFFNHYLTIYDDHHLKIKRMLYYNNRHLMINYTVKVLVLLIITIMISLFSLNLFIDFYHQYLIEIKNYFSLNNNVIDQIHVNHLLYILTILISILFIGRYLKLVKYPYSKTKK